MVTKHSDAETITSTDPEPTGQESDLLAFGGVDRIKRISGSCHEPDLDHGHRPGILDDQIDFTGPDPNVRREHDDTF